MENMSDVVGQQHTLGTILLSKYYIIHERIIHHIQRHQVVVHNIGHICFKEQNSTTLVILLQRIPGDNKSLFFFFVKGIIVLTTSGSITDQQMYIHTQVYWINKWLDVMDQPSDERIEPTHANTQANKYLYSRQKRKSLQIHRQKTYGECHIMWRYEYTQIPVAISHMYMYIFFYSLISKRQI